MEANELRYKNYFLHNGFIVQISGFRAYSTDKPLIRFEMMGGEYDINSLTCIPLSEEILLKCGFRKSKSGMYLLDKFSFDLSDFEFGVESDYYYLIIAENIKHLHQLQNLYFALTGQELEINL